MRKTHAETGCVNKPLSTILFVNQVYYLPIVPFYNKSVLPTIVGSLPFFRRIFTKESIQIVHGHSAFSTLAHEVRNINQSSEKRAHDHYTLLITVYSESRFM